jgi:hypothetical protein
MLTLKQFLELIEYKVTEGSEWFGNIPNLHSLSYWNGKHDDGGVSMNIVFSTKDQTVYLVEVCDYERNKAYRLHNPELKTDDEAWDGVRYTTLETVEDFIEKAKAIMSGKDYDTRVTIPLELTDQEMLTLFKMAHERDMTFNDFVCELIEQQCRQMLKDQELVDDFNKIDIDDWA